MALAPINKHSARGGQSIITMDALPHSMNVEQELLLRQVIEELKVQSQYLFDIRMLLMRSLDAGSKAPDEAPRSR